MPRIVHRVLLPLTFPAGVSAGEEKAGNLLVVARDGRGRPVLRGTALAGALRHAYARSRKVRHGDPSVTCWFGMAHDESGDHASPLIVPDSVLESGGVAATILRTHNARNRHTGAAQRNSLFDMEAVPPGTAAAVCIWLVEEGEVDARGFLTELVGLLRTGLVLGGHGARGVGQVKLSKPALHRSFRCADLSEHAALIDEQHAWREGRPPQGGQELCGTDGPTSSLRIDVVLTVPRGEDLLVGDGQGFDHQLEPQRVRCADGQDRWRLPGSSLRGVLRGWIARLAARAGEPIADSLARRESTKGEVTGDDLAWGYVHGESRERIQDDLAADPARLADLVPCPVMRLFGSGFSRSRIHVGDALSEDPVQQRQQQTRTHVAVDRLTGGANEGFLFTTAVLAGRPRFPVTIVIEEPTKGEVDWLVASLRALDLGVLRVGSSKAGGRLALASVPTAKGPFENLFKGLVPSEV